MMDEAFVYVIYDDLWDMYFGGRDSWFCNLEKAALFASAESASVARAELRKTIARDSCVLSVHKVRVDMTRRVMVA